MASDDEVPNQRPDPENSPLYEIGSPGPLLDPDATKRITDWAKKYWTKEKLCPVCETSAWLIEPRLFAAVRTEVPIGRSQFPVTCKECGYTMWINAIRAKVKVKPNPSDKDGG